MIIEGYVWCDHYGMIHKDVKDPMKEGPTNYSKANEWQPEAWVFKSAPETGYDGEMWHFECPGEHKELQTAE